MAAGKATAAALGAVSAPADERRPLLYVSVCDAHAGTRRGSNNAPLCDAAGAKIFKCTQVESCAFLPVALALSGSVFSHTRVTSWPLTSRRAGCIHLHVVCLWLLPHNVHAKAHSHLQGSRTQTRTELFCNDLSFR